MARQAPSVRVDSFSHWLGRVLFTRQRRESLFSAYKYFRWLDDVVDAEGISRESARTLVSEERKCLLRAYDCISHEATHPVQGAMLRVIRTDLRDRLLYPMITDFLDALTWDVERRYTLCSRADLEQYSQRLGRAYASGLLYGFGLDPTAECYGDIPTQSGTAAHLAHVLRDLQVDLQVGYANVAREDIEAFGLDLGCLDANPWERWRQDVARRACQLFEEARRQRHLLPTLRATLGYDLVSTRYEGLARRYMRGQMG